MASEHLGHFEIKSLTILLILGGRVALIKRLWEETHAREATSSVTRYWTKKYPNFPKICQKMLPAKFFLRRDVFKIAQKSLYIWATFVI